MHGVGTKEKFEKTLLSKYLEDENSVKYKSWPDWADNLKTIWEQRNTFPTNLVIVFILFFYFTLEYSSFTSSYYLVHVVYMLT